MKKLFTLMLAAMLMVSAVACADYTPGTYTAEGPGRNGPVVIEVTFDETSITDAKVVSHKETAHIGTWAIDEMPGKLVEKQHMPDMVSGATQTSVALYAAIADAIKQAGGDVAAMTAKLEAEPVAEAAVECDVVVVGAGGAGLSAAIALKNAGKNVILIEKEGILGGTSVTASSYISGWGTSVHEKANSPMTAEIYGQYFVSAKLWEENPTAAQRMVDLTPVMMEDLMSYGADLSNLIDGLFQMGPADGSTIGGIVIPAMVSEVERLGIDVRRNTKAISIINENGAAKGVVVETKGGTYEIHADAVMMTFGGYFHNKELVEKYSPQYAQYGTTWSVGSTGEGLAMCQEMGAYLGGMETPTINPTGYPVPGTDNMMSFSNFRYYGCILVGASTGTRFHNELGDYTAIAMAMPEGKAYAVFDDAVFQSSVTIQEYFDLGYFMKADTLEELAALVNLDPATLKKTVEDYTAIAKAGVDEEFGRTQFASDLSTAPYYITTVPVEPALHSAVGGVVTNGRGQAIREDGSVIEGLYVAGNAADNTFQPNALAGVTFARVVSEYIVEDIAK